MAYCACYIFGYHGYYYKSVLFLGSLSPWRHLSLVLLLSDFTPDASPLAFTVQDETMSRTL